MNCSSINTLPKPSKEYKVLVRCFTYNQSKFIVDTLEGFAKQQTKYPFVCLVIDDASTDGEQDVIQSWLHGECDLECSECFENEEVLCITAPHKKNNNCFMSVYLLKKNLYGSPRKIELVQPWRKACLYEAICEGDDYWLDETKLQKQSDILDMYSNIQMVYTDYETVDENSLPIYREKYEKVFKPMSMTGDNLPRLMKRNYPLTVTILIRKDIIESEFYKNSPSKIDYALFLAAAFEGDFYYIPEKTSAYRLNLNSMTQTQQASVQVQTMQIRKNASEYFINNNKREYSLLTLIKIYYYMLYHAVAPNIDPIMYDYFRVVLKEKRFVILYVPIIFCIKILKKLFWK